MGPALPGGLCRFLSLHSASLAVLCPGPLRAAGPTILPFILVHIPVWGPVSVDALSSLVGQNHQEFPCLGQALMVPGPFSHLGGPRFPGPSPQPVYVGIGTGRRQTGANSALWCPGCGITQVTQASLSLSFHLSEIG